MEETYFDNQLCAACGKLVKEQGKYVYNTSIFREKYVKDCDDRIEIQPLNPIDLDYFCEKCLEEEKAVELMKKNMKGKDVICRSCGNIVSNEGSIEWIIYLGKHNITKSTNCVWVVWSDSLYTYCEECGNSKDLHIDAYQCTLAILNHEVRDHFEPYKGKFIPSQLEFCEGCGSLKEEEEAPFQKKNGKK